MSRFLREGLRNLTPYTPGEQPKTATKLIKLNTNESPFPPSPAVLAAITGGEPARLNLYSDPTAAALKGAIAARLGVPVDTVVCSNGSDEILAFAVNAFCDASRGMRTPDITYGFYPVFCSLFGVPMTVCPLREDFSVDTADYLTGHETVMLANPNAQTGVALPLSDIEAIVAADPGRVVIIDEAYVDFGGESAVPLTRKYANLLVVGTFSKSRSLAGARIGFAVGDKALIADLETVRNSFNPYNLNRLSLLAGAAAMADNDYFEKTRNEIIRVRENTKTALAALGFAFPDSRANFILATHPAVGGEELYRMLRERGILVRHFETTRIRDYNRITVGSKEEMQTLLDTLRDILAERTERTK